jgi:hypothetical protein
VHGLTLCYPAQRSPLYRASLSRWYSREGSSAARSSAVEGDWCASASEGLKCCSRMCRVAPDDEPDHSGGAWPILAGHPLCSFVKAGSSAKAARGRRAHRRDCEQVGLLHDCAVKRDLKMLISGFDYRWDDKVVQKLCKGAQPFEQL